MSNNYQQVVNSPSRQEQEQLFVGNAHTVIRFLGVMTICLLFAGIYFGYQLGKVEEKVAFLEDIVINKTYVVKVKGE